VHLEILTAISTKYLTDSISLRELFTHVLHKLAPDSEIRSWTSSPEYFDRGNPTRKARLLFICRDINYDPFSAFVEKDITSVLSFWEVLNRAHEIVIPFSQRQLTAFKIRMEGALRLLLVTWNSRK
jgi:Predicted pPIWI-associating nuclease